MYMVAYIDDVVKGRSTLNSSAIVFKHSMDSANNSNSGKLVRTLHNVKHVCIE